MLKRNLLILAALIAFSSCEDSMILKSEKKMKADLQGTWQKSYQGKIMYAHNCPNLGDSTLYNEFWTFEGDMLYTTFEYETPIPCDRGTTDSVYTDGIDTAIVSRFKVDARILDAFLKFQLISGADDSAYAFIDKWEFVTLDDDVLYLATDDPQSNSVLQLEFSKVK